jgi:SET domain-containing protein
MILSCLYTEYSDERGWGVYTDTALEVDMIVEVSPVIVMSADEKKLLDQTALYNYIFDWTDDQCCMAMGNVPVYNHSYQSNCEYIQDFEEKVIYIKTMRAIEAGEELFVNYNGDWDDDKKVWFEVK